MKKNFGTDSLKRCISALLALVMLMSCAGISAFAEEGESCEHSSTTTREESGTAATCTEDGWHIVIIECNDCGEKNSYTEADPALGHDYQEASRTEATCEAEGSVTYTCSRCSDSYTLTLPKLEAEIVPVEQSVLEQQTTLEQQSVQELQPIPEVMTVQEQTLQITEGSSAYGSFMADSFVSEGTELRYEAAEIDAAVLDIVKNNAAGQMNADPSELQAFACNVWLSAPDGSVVGTGADVALETALPLPVVDEKAEEPVSMQVDKIIAVYASEDGTLHYQQAKASTEKGSITAISFYAPEPATYAICYTLKEPEESPAITGALASAEPEQEETQAEPELQESDAKKVTAKEEAKLAAKTLGRTRESTDNVYTVTLTPGTIGGIPIVYRSDEGTIAESVYDSHIWQFYYEDNGAMGFRMDVQPENCPFTPPAGIQLAGWKDVLTGQEAGDLNRLFDMDTTFAAVWTGGPAILGPIEDIPPVEGETFCMNGKDWQIIGMSPAYRLLISADVLTRDDWRGAELYCDGVIYPGFSDIEKEAMLAVTKVEDIDYGIYERASLNAKEMFLLSAAEVDWYFFSNPAIDTISHGGPARLSGPLKRAM